MCHRHPQFLRQVSGTARLPQAGPSKAACSAKSRRRASRHPDVALLLQRLLGCLLRPLLSNPDYQAGGALPATARPAPGLDSAAPQSRLRSWPAFSSAVNQHTGSRWETPTPSITRCQHRITGYPAVPPTNSTTVDKTATPASSYDVTQGDNDAVCKRPGRNVYNQLHPRALPDGTYGILSLQLSSQPAYLTNVGWTSPPGIGSVNALQSW